MIVEQLLQGLDMGFVLRKMKDFAEDPSSFVEPMYALIDEQSPSFKEFLRVITITLGIDAMSGAVVALGFLHRRAEMDEATKKWIYEGLFAKPDWFFERHAISFVTAENEFYKRGEEFIERNALPFRMFLRVASTSYGLNFTTGAATVIELLVRVEESDEVQRN